MYKLRPWLSFKTLQIKCHEYMGTNLTLSTPYKYKILKRLSVITKKQKMEYSKQKPHEKHSKPEGTKNVGFSSNEEQRKHEIHLKSNKLRESLMRIAEKFYNKKRSDVHLRRNQYLCMSKNYNSHSYFLTHLSISSTMVRGIHEHPPEYCRYFFGFPADRCLNRRGFATQRPKLKDVYLSRAVKEGKNRSGESDDRHINSEKWDKFVSSIVGENAEGQLNQNNPKEVRRNTQLKENTDKNAVNTIENYDLNESDMQDFRLDEPELEEGSNDLKRHDKSTSTNSLGSVKVVPKTEELIRRKQLMKTTRSEEPQRSIIVPMSKNPERENQDKQEPLIGDSDTSWKNQLDGRFSNRKQLNNFFANKPTKATTNDINYPGDNFEVKLSNEVLKKYQSPKNSFLEHKLKEALCFDKSSDYQNKPEFEEEVTFYQPANKELESDVMMKVYETGVGNRPDKKKKVYQKNDSLVFELESSQKLVEVKNRKDGKLEEEEDEEDDDGRENAASKSGVSKQSVLESSKNRTDFKNSIKPESVQTSPISTMGKNSEHQLHQSDSRASSNYSGLIRGPESVTKLDDEDFSDIKTKKIIDNNLKKGLRKVLAFCQSLHRNYDGSLKKDYSKIDYSDFLDNWSESNKTGVSEGGDSLKMQKGHKKFSQPVLTERNFDSKKVVGRSAADLLKETFKSTSEPELKKPKVCDLKKVDKVSKIDKSSSKSWRIMKQEPRNHSFNSLDQDRIRASNLGEEMMNTGETDAMLPLQILSEETLQYQDNREYNDFEKTKSITPVLTGVDEKIQGSNEVKPKEDEELLVKSSEAKTDLQEEMSTKVDSGLLQAAKKLMHCSEPQLRSAMEELINSYDLKDASTESPSSQLCANNTSGKRKGTLQKPKYPMYNQKSASRMSTVTKKGDSLVLNITIKIPLDTVKPTKEKGVLKTESFLRKKWIREGEVD